MNAGHITREAALAGPFEDGPPFGRVQEIRDALEDDAVFNVVGEVLPAAHVERVLRDYYAGRLGDADLEERLSQARGRCGLSAGSSS